jgi:hypothetical protein
MTKLLDILEAVSVIAMFIRILTTNVVVKQFMLDGVRYGFAIASPSYR